MFRWLTSWVSPAPEHPNPDAFDPFSSASQRSNGAGGGVGGQEEFDENLKEARDIISQLEGLVLKMETKRQTKRGTKSRGRQKRKASSSVDKQAKGKEREGKGSPNAAATKTVSGTGSPLSSSASPASKTAATTTTQSPKKPFLFTMPPINRNEPIVNNGMTLLPGQSIWQGGEELRIDDDDEDRIKPYQPPLRKSSPRKTGVGRALRAEDYVLDDTGEWVKMDDPHAEMSEKEKSQPRLFLIRYLNPNVTNKMAGKMRLVEGRWIPNNDDSSEGDDVDFADFGDDEELNRWSEVDSFYPELPREFDAGEENLAQWRRRESEHKMEMSCWNAPEKEPKRFLLDGLRQMYIIRVVDQANTRGRMWRQNKVTTSPAPAVSTVVSRPSGGIPTKLKSLEKFKDDGDFDQDLDVSAPLTPRKKPDADEDDNFDDAASASNSDEDWGNDFAISPTKKFDRPSESLSGIEIGDDDEEDMEVDKANTVNEDDDSFSLAENAYAEEPKAGDNSTEDWGDEFAAADLASNIAQSKFRLNIGSIDDDDEEDGEEDGDDELEDRRRMNQRTENGGHQESEEDEDWAMEEDNKVEMHQATKNILKDLVIEDDDSDEEFGEGQGLDRSRSGSFNTFEAEDDLMMHNVGGILHSDARRSVNRK